METQNDSNSQISGSVNSTVLDTVPNSPATQVGSTISRSAAQLQLDGLTHADLKFIVGAEMHYCDHLNVFVVRPAGYQNLPKPSGYLCLGPASEVRQLIVRQWSVLKSLFKHSGLKYLHDNHVTGTELKLQTFLEYLKAGRSVRSDFVPPTGTQPDDEVWPRCTDLTSGTARYPLDTSGDSRGLTTIVMRHVHALMKNEAASFPRSADAQIDVLLQGVDPENVSRGVKLLSFTRDRIIDHKEGLEGFYKTVTNQNGITNARSIKSLFKYPPGFSPAFDTKVDAHLESVESAARAKLNAKYGEAEGT